MNSVMQIISDENIRASREHGEFFHSDHEGIGVIAEEYEETVDELAHCRAQLLKFWEAVKTDAADADKERLIIKAYNDALFAACECVQLAQTLFKAGQTIRQRRKNDDSNRS